ncbi:MAG: methylenetetrahydrofolate reductase [Acidimicrobiia bacterium]|nr:methylenetetrahydrofolate reductase [Acidimicrobiia bacterium]
MSTPSASSPFIAERLAAGRSLSFEFFPPADDVAARSLEKTVHRLAELDPTFVSVTYGAGGSTRDNTRDLVVDVNTHQNFPAMPHLTCMGHTRGQLVELLDDYAEHGVANILALAGDPPADGSPVTGDFRYASQLVELVRERTNFSIGVAAFPETHPRSAGRDDDRRHLAAKLARADFGITQFFFHADDHLRMLDELAALGCDTPVLPGVIPVVNPTSIRRFAVMNGAKVPEDLWNRLEATEGDERLDIAVDAATVLCQRLLDAGAPGIHFYTLNRTAATARVCTNLAL